MNVALFDKTREWISEQLGALRSPSVACSFGKDSMVMLYLIREQMPDIPVLYFEHFDIPSKHAFARKVAAQWDLNLRVIPPSARTFYGRMGHVELLALHKIGPTHFISTPIESQKELPETGFLCGMDQLADELPTPDGVAYDGVFIGHRNDDEDILMGKIPLAQDIYETDGFRYLYPLRDWTAKDIWDFNRRYGVPVNGDRYGKKDVEANNDLWPICTACMGGVGRVYCPKEQQDVFGLAPMLGLDERTAFWRDRSINLENAA